jgi:hypothetical protein
MALSPIVAGIAYLVPVTAHAGVLQDVPGLFWLGILAQCLFTFRWRGLWFLLGPPVAILAIVAFLDGTFTVQKEPANGNSKDAKAKDGLVIPPPAPK